MPLRMEDFSAFSKVLSAALLVFGFIVLWLLVGRQAVARGGPLWAVPACTALGALVGMTQGWVMIRPLWKNRGRR